MKGNKFEPGIDGREYDTTNVEQDLGRIDKSWPEDEFGAKLSLGPNYGWLLRHMGQGDIDMMTNGEAVDPPRYYSQDPEPGSYEFGERARVRRANIAKRRREEYRPEDPNDTETTDIVTGKKTSLKKRRQELEDAGNF